MENLVPGFATKVFVAAMKNYLGESGKAVQWVAVLDIGVFAAKAFIDPEAWNRKAVGLAGDELTMAQLDRAFVKVTGSPAPVTFWFLGSVLTRMVQDLRMMLEWFASHGYGVKIAELRRKHPDLLTMEEWLSKKCGFAP
jgi:hypothetical protein